MKRILALFLTALMILAMSPISTLAEGAELRTINILAIYPTTGLTPEEAREMPMWADFEALWAEKGIKLELEYVDGDQYATVLQARIAANDMPDVFRVNPLGEATMMSLIESGKILAADDVLQYSDGTASYALSEEGYLYPIRQKNTMEDGKLWYFTNGSMLPSVDSTDDNFGYNAVTSNTYSMKVRKDWLDELGMEAPTTLDEFFDMLVAFQENDMNGNGVKDERMVICTTTCDLQWGGLFDNGVAGWFGLAPYVFQLNRVTWKAEVPFLQEGFIPYVEFLKKCVDAGVLYLSDSVGKNDSNTTMLMAQNVVSAYFMRADVDDAATPEGAVYQTLGPIVGVEGIEPVMDGSRGWKSFESYGFRADMDPQLAADYLDVVYSIEWSEFFSFGVEGKSYEILDNGLYDFYAPTDKEEYKELGYTTCYNLLGDGNVTRTSLEAYYQTFNGESLIWDSYEDFVNSDYFNEFYTADFSETTIENIKTWCKMADTLQKYNMNGDLDMIAPIVTAEEAEILDMYNTDLFTYMDELFANLLNGVWSTEDYDLYVEELYNYGLQEVLDVHQARYDRIVR